VRRGELADRRTGALQGAVARVLSRHRARVVSSAAILIAAWFAAVIVVMASSREVSE